MATKARVVARPTPGRCLRSPDSARNGAMDTRLGDDYQDMVDHWDRLGIVVSSESQEVPFFVERERDTNALGP